jgi:hypothetical protein
MSNWFQHVFETTSPMQYQFGRGLNASINVDEAVLYKRSSTAFEEGHPLRAYADFLQALATYIHGKPTNNVTLQMTTDILQFQLLQGTAIVHGHITASTLEATCLIANATASNIAIKRRLLERNYELTYARFSVENQQIMLKIRLDNSTMTPQKTFYPLREIALNADYEKEYIAGEFSGELLLDCKAIMPLDTAQINEKYRAMQAWIEACEATLQRLPSNDNVGMSAFTYLTLLLKIDYLIVPKQWIGQQILTRLSEYFSDDDYSVAQKNAKLQTLVETLKQMPYETFAKQLYNVTTTFSPMESTTQAEVVNFIDETLNKLYWYKSNHYTNVLITIYHYIALSLQYNFTLHPTVQRLLHLLIKVQHSHFFITLGYKPLYISNDNTFEKQRIIQRIEEIIKPYQKQFKQLKPFGKQLDFSSIEEFSHSFYIQIKHLDFTEASQ